MQKTKKINEEQKKPFDPKKYEEEIKKLNDEITLKNNKIETLESELRDLNTKYKDDLILKSKEAQEKIIQMINQYKVKADEEIKNIKKYAIKKDAIELISIINQFDNVVNSKIDNEAVKNYVSGFRMFLNMFENLLSSMGINEIPIKIGQEFDEKYMEAIDIKIDPSQKENTIDSIVKKGYKLYDQILIYAQVIVYKTK
ncbi:MAG: nucleotide exchange factor GrpE [Mycoplasmoidaceae bacterium]